MQTGKRWYWLGGIVLMTVGMSGCGDHSNQSGNGNPALSWQIDSPEDDPTLKNVGMPDPEGDQIREQNRAKLATGGFQAAGTLPTLNHRAGISGNLRAPREIALRLMSLKALYVWVAAPADAVPSDRITAYVNKNQLHSHLTSGEQKILAMPREQAHAEFSNTIGWRLENMWALAWLLGYETPPDAMSGQLSEQVIDTVLFEFLPNLDSTIDDLMQKIRPRPREEVVQLEDLFYCAHNAVRSAQTGSTNTVPAGFDPIADGGAIHERRHSLTWAISEGVAWDDTDLST
ncbi:MAG: DUF4272 domain-containing protein [Planctomycetaceae bacterium]|nr:DUF4272 domain-containing protein [Planctomycetaceae bacterium]